MFKYYQKMVCFRVLYLLIDTLFLLLLVKKIDVKIQGDP
jgi:hypothetical protein